MLPPYNALICRYNEIWTKGRNRGLFEEQLSYGLIRAFLKIGQVRTQYEHGRLFIFPPKDREFFTEEEIALIRTKAGTIAGLSSLSPGYYLPPEIQAIRDKITETFHLFAKAFLEKYQGNSPSYAMRARRSDKQFPFTCEELERQFAELLLPDFPQFHLNLKKPDFRVDLEIRRHQAFVSYETIQGPGGLPAGSGGRVLALLSGGFDSPVACYQMMHRGCLVDFLTFHSEPYTPPAYLTKVANLVKVLNQYQKRGRLISVNLLPAQKAIRDNCHSRYRTVLYRRMMLRIATAVADRLKDAALVTGDNIGQVASQTLENMAVINAATPLLILRPLLTYDKLQTMAIAQEIDTFRLSIENVPDSCTVFAPDDPCTSSTLAQIEEDEQNLDIPELVRICLASAVFLNPCTYTQYPLLEQENTDDNAAH